MIMTREDVMNQIRLALGKSTSLSREELAAVTEGALLEETFDVDFSDTQGFLYHVEQSLHIKIPQMCPPFAHGGNDMFVKDLLDCIMKQLEAKEDINEYDEDGSGKLKPPVSTCEVCDDKYHWYAGCMGMCPDCLSWVRNFPSTPNHIKKVAKAVCDTMEGQESPEEVLARLL